ncbi:damage-control phosphatase ARMT1 isoform X1 [Lucilia sericata]|uniref:damage-control phosphatase ARMT1 isoform X1 n=2 Tax=Lucilia sericata TaxID=13632 RepID=UPI0018A87658|nr:damage-control phosphatase ARMT1 isoform X1 [Lucilia sericata]
MKIFTMSLGSPAIQNDQIINENCNPLDLDEFDLKHGIINGPTPPNVPLKGQYKQSFAYYTFRQRLPNTLNTIFKSLEQTGQEKEFPYSPEELNSVREQVVQLKKQLENNEPLQLFKGNETDRKLWNSFISNLAAEQNSFYKTCWLYAECYMYRKLASFFEATQTLTNYDFFAQQKFQALKLASEVMVQVAQNTQNPENNVQTFQKLLKLNLWGNRCDLSITSGQEVKPLGNLMDIIDTLNDNILIDHSAAIWHCLQHHHDSRVIVDFICDNAGFELFTDLLLAQYLIDHRLCHTVRFNLKSIPWYVSDTTAQDVHGTLKYLKEHQSLELKRLGNIWSQYFEDERFVLASREDFWTSPYEFYRMPDINASLYQTLQQSALLIFKGDLNYRKLLGDFNWDFSEKFETCLRGFRPTNLCTLRTVKGDLICDLKPGLAEELSRQNKDWMFTGEYGLIQFLSKE